MVAKNGGAPFNTLLPTSLVRDSSVAVDPDVLLLFRKQITDCTACLLGGVCPLLWERYWPDVPDKKKKTKGLA